MRRILFLITGPSHLPNLVVAVASLRKVWDGQIDLMVWDESWEIARRIAQDERLGIMTIKREPSFRGRNATFVDKTLLIPTYPASDSVLFLDADVTIHGQLDELFDLVDQHGFVASRWNNWQSNGPIISGRINTLLEFPEVDPDFIRLAMSNPWPSVNSGIFAAKSDSPIHPLWHHWTYAARSTFIPDEKTLHVIQAKYHNSSEFVVAGLDGRYNCSPKYQPSGLKDEDVVVRHFHGDSNLRPDKSLKGFDLWWPLYQQALSENLGSMADWRRGLNKWLDALEK